MIQDEINVAVSAIGVLQKFFPISACRAKTGLSSIRDSEKSGGGHFTAFLVGESLLDGLCPIFSESVRWFGESKPPEPVMIRMILRRRDAWFADLGRVLSTNAGRAAKGAMAGALRAGASKRRRLETGGETARLTRRPFGLPRGPGDHLGRGSG